MRDRLIDKQGEPGARFSAWWQFEQGRPRPRLWCDEYRELKRLREIIGAEEQAFERRPG